MKNAQEINYAALLPKEPPEDLLEWLLAQNKFNKEYLIYRHGRRFVPLEERWEDCVEVTCTSCGRTFEADKMKAGGCHNAYAPAPFGWFDPRDNESVISGRHTICPACDTYAETVHVGNMQYGITDCVYTTVVSRIPIEGKMDRLLLTDWRTARRIDKMGNIRYEHKIWTAWVVEERKIIRISGHGQLFYNPYVTEPQRRKVFYDDYGKYDHLYPLEPRVIEGTTAENSKLDLYIEAGGVRLVAYLALWRKRPAVENLVMQGCGKLVDDLIDEEQRTFGQRKGIPKLDKIDWKAKRPHQMMHMGKSEWRSWGRRMNVSEYDLWAWAIKNELPVDFEKLQLMKGAYGDVGSVLKLTGKDDFYRGVKYLKTQKETCTVLRDYWNMAKKLQMDLDDAQVRWPPNLKRAHDQAVERYNARKDELDNAAFTERLKVLNGMEWHWGGILIRPCATAEELRSEGKILHHCVATYADRHKSGQTAIFFIRKEEEPDKPWFTLELDEKNLKVRQNRGMRNCGKTPEVQEFEDRWIEHLNQQRKKKPRKKKEVKVA